MNNVQLLVSKIESQLSITQVLLAELKKALEESDGETA